MSTDRAACTVNVFTAQFAHGMHRQRSDECSNVIGIKGVEMWCEQNNQEY